jgi:hypothetical protein
MARRGGFDRLVFLTKGGLKKWLSRTIFGDDEQPMPSVAYSGDNGQSDRPGFGEYSSYNVPPQQADTAPISRHVVPARVGSSGPDTHSSDPGDRFGTGAPDRHIK